MPSRNDALIARLHRALKQGADTDQVIDELASMVPADKLEAWLHELETEIA